MSDFVKHFPDAELMIAMEPEELALYLLQYFKSLQSDQRRESVMRRGWIGGKHSVEDYPPKYRGQVAAALVEAFHWLEREGFIGLIPVYDREPPFDSYYITKRGMQVRGLEVAAFRSGKLLPRMLLHPRIATHAVGPFLRGEYETAVFAAFKEVEIAVRDAGKYSATEIGVLLMRKAFHPETGPLSDASLPATERHGLADLFAGGMGYYRNPLGHRHLPITDPGEAAEMIIFASHLMRLVEARVAATTPPKADSGLTPAESK